MLPVVPKAGGKSGTNKIVGDMQVGSSGKGGSKAKTLGSMKKHPGSKSARKRA